MEQRTPRLGDIVDDYCPRERRITNHAIVAIVEDAIRQTRCTTCEAEHVFKQGREPRRRKKEPETLYEQVLADVAGTQLVPARAEASPEDVSPAADPAVGTDQGDDPDAQSGDSEPAAPADGWPAHRRLIRAALPKIEGELPPPRPIPEFTMHQRPPQRAGRFRFSQGQANGDQGGFREGRSGRSFQGNGHANGNGNTHGNGNGNGSSPGGQRGGGNPAGRSARRRGPGPRGR